MLLPVKIYNLDLFLLSELQQQKLQQIEKEKKVLALADLGNQEGLKL